MNWTHEQQQAIEIRDKSIIVSASAGSGKTAVLIERLLQILSDLDRHIRADEMIVVTFTNDAAAEMKQRLTKALSEKLDAMSRNQQQDELYSWLLQQRSLLGNAKISTIHAFCFDLIRENAEECGVSSQFRIAESGQDAIYRRRAIQTVLEQFSKKQPEQAELLFSCFCTRNDKKLEQVITGIDRYLNSLAFPDYWMTQAERLCQEENTYLLDSMREAFCSRITDAVTIAEYGREIAHMAIVSPDGKYPYEEQILDPEISMMQSQMQYVRTANREELLANPELYSVGFTGLNKIKTAGCQKDNQQKKLFTEIRNLYKEIYQNACKKLLAPLKFYEEDEKIQNQVIPLLLNLTKQYREELFQEKKRQNVLGFDDAEYLVLTKLLGQVDEHGKIHKTELAEALSEQYQLIMVDEYQDSNNRQDCLFRLLAHGNSETLNYGDNIFMVGDVKQSIYRFRNANPENFMSAIEKSHSEPMMQTIYLNQNFRSSRGVVNFVNALFTSMMTQKCGEVAYSKHEKLNFGANIYDNLAENHQRTKILIAQAPEQKEEKTKSFVIQAECIADTIMKMIAEKAPVMTKDGIRPCEYKDFCVLMRTKTPNSILAEAFQKRNIPFLCQESNQFLALPEIRLIWNLLRIADNPMTDMAMASVLLSPLYGFSAEELAVLKFLASDKKRLYLQIRYLTEQKTAPEYAVLTEKCNGFLRQLEQIRKLADRLPLETCIQEIYEITDLLSLQSLYENADERRENLEIFSQYAQNYREHADLSAQSCLSGWLRYLDHLEESEEEDDFAPKNAIHANTNFVSVKTIHKAKGLEYPFVFVANLDRNFSNGHSKNGTESVMAEESGLLGLNMLDQKQYLKIKTVAFTYLNLIRTQKEKQEEMRLLYVALTRAKQQLFLVFDESVKKCKYTGLCEDYPEISKAFAGEAKNMQDWILWFLFSSGQGDFIRNAFSEVGSHVNSDLADYLVWTPVNQIQEKPEQTAIPEIKPDDTMISAIHKQLAYLYDSSQTVLPSKYSVTELSHEMDEIQIREPEFLRHEEKVKRLHGTAKGTAIHKMMQYMDFQKAQQDLSSELERIRNKGYLTSLEIQALRPEKLEKFFNSSLYQRIAVSDQVQKEKQIFVRIADLDLPETSELFRNYADTDGIIIGTMDLLFHELDGWVIVDYKTDRSQETEELLRKYSKQLGLYQKAAELILGESVKQAYIYYFTKDQTIEVDLSQIAY